MVVATKEVSKRAEVTRRKALIRQNIATGEMVAGFLDPMTGVFEVVKEINDESDIDEFVEDYDLSVVMISRM